MEFDEIVVKETPGLCRCCLSEGCYKDLSTEYNWMDDQEIYADMLLECFDISISQHIDGPNGPNRLICEVCITRLRDACNFKKQVLDSEKKFVDMLGRGEFRERALSYTESKTDISLELLPIEEGEVEYLDNDMDYDDDVANKDELEATVSEEVTVAPLPVKGKRGRPKKTVVKAEKKKPKVDDKPKTRIAKGITLKREYQGSCLERLATVRRNIMMLLHYGNVTPFNWNTRGFRCFYCSKEMRDCESLKEHTTTSHKKVDLETFIPQRIISKDVPVKIDITQLGCTFCDKSIANIEDLKAHIVAVHGEEYDETAGVCVFPFLLNKEMFHCVLCDEEYDNFTTLVGHMYKKHMEQAYMCQVCGQSYTDKIRLKRHISKSHVGPRCKICGKKFEAYHHVEKHKKMVHGIHKTVECDLCSTSFMNQYRLKVHMGKVHNVEKYRLKCEHCPKICTTKGAMMLHVQSLHSETRFECDICEYKTGIKWMLKLHRRKHFGEKNYVCSMCDRRFGRSSNLRAHMKVHTGNFGRVCRWCRYGFIDFESLDKHEKESHLDNLNR